MAKPTTITLSKKEQQLILREFKTTKNARKIADNNGLKRLHVMAFLEEKGLCSFSESSYC